MILSAERIKHIEKLILNTYRHSFGNDAFSCKVCGNYKFCFFYFEESGVVTYCIWPTRENYPYQVFMGNYAGKYNLDTISSLLCALANFDLITYEERFDFMQYLESEDAKIKIELNNNFNRLEQEAKEFGFKLSR
jgi:hypothetical protein